MDGRYEMECVVATSDLGRKGCLKLRSLIDYLQDCSVFQSESLGVGIEHLEKTKTAWILNSWQICINKMPSLGDEIFVQTWPYDMKGFFGYRNFQIVDKEGNVLAFANTVWIYVNTETGRPLRIPQELMDIYVQEPPIEMECGERKMTAPEEYVEKESLVVMRDSVSFWKDGLRRLLKNKVAMVSAFIILLIIAIVIMKKELDSDIKRIDGFDKPDGSNRNQILHHNSCIFKLFGNIYHKTKIMLYQKCTKHICIFCIQSIDCLILFNTL